MPEKRSIAFLCHPYHRGGVTRWMADAAMSLSAEGHEVYFITVDPEQEFVSGKGREKMVCILRQPENNVRLVSKVVDYTFEFGTIEFRAKVFSDLVRKNVPVGTPVIISDDSAVWMAAGDLADRFNIVGVLHGDQDVYYGLAGQYKRQLSVFVCVSSRIKRKLTERCPEIEQGKIVTIPCGIDLPLLTPVESTDSGVLRLVFIGRLTDYEKRAEDLVKICSLLHKQKTVFHLDIAGNDEVSKEEFGKAFREAGVGANVSFHGWRTKGELQVLLNGADVLLLTSNSEGMPLVMMEALASGCGMVATRVSGVEDYENHPLAPYCLGVYAVGVIEDAVKKIKEIAAVPKGKRVKAARAIAESEFTMSVCNEKYLNAIADIAQHSVRAEVSKVNLPITAVLYSHALAVARYCKVALLKRK